MSASEVKRQWSTEFYRQWQQPAPRDVLYMQNADLKLALEQYATQEPVRIVDYGCGGSPYRFLFPNARFERADIAPYDGVDHLIRPDQVCDAPSAAYDIVLSTQAAEHVADPQAFFADIYRLTKPGGRAIITTHGTSEDHGLPFDFQRWTAEGLRRDLERAGFTEIRMDRVTVDFRAWLFALICMFKWLPPLPRRTARIPLRLFTRLVFAAIPIINRLADYYLPHQRVVPVEDPNRRMYLILAACAYRPLPNA
jgi:SAM-dependent methyltransferase